jgi:hypothetical protein
MNKVRDYFRTLQSWEKAALVLGALGYVAISYKYRNYMGDFGDFVNAGRMIWQNTDPYSHLMYVNSPVSAVVVYGLNNAFPFLFFPLFWQTLNLAGLIFFFKTFVRKDARRALPLVFAGFAFLNVTRALLGNGQVTGLVLGLFAIGITLAKRKFSVFVVMLPIWLAAEVKPQLALGFIALFLFQGRIQKERILVLGSYIFLSHTLVELKFAGNINYLWVQKLLKYSSASLTQGYEISYWKAIAIYFGNSIPVRAFSTFFIFLTLGFIIVMAKKGRTDWALFIAILLPLQNTYLHLYDLAPLGVLAILGIYTHRSILMLITFCIFLQFFPLKLTTQVIIAGVLIIFLLAIKKKKMTTLNCVFTISVTLGMALILFYMLRYQTEELQIIDLLVLPAIALVLINRRKFVGFL